MQKNRVLVIGAGVSGLAAAYRLKQRGFEVKILDARAYAGGVINTFTQDGFKAESGSNSIMVQSQKTLDFFNEIGLKDEVANVRPQSKKRFFVRHGKLQEVPMSPMTMLKTRLLSPFGKLRLMMEPLMGKFSADADPSVSEFVKARMGKEALDYMMNPFFSGIYAGNTDRLSIRHCFPAFWNFEQKYGSIFWGAMKSRKEKAAAGNLFKPMMVSFKNGMSTLPEKLAELLGDSLVLNAQISQIDYEGVWKAAWSSPQEDGYEAFDHLVLAVPSWSLKKLPLCGTLAAALEPLDKIEGSPMTTLTLGFKREDVEHPLDGFGALIPEKEKCSIIGSLFLSSLFENRAPAGCVTLTNYVGGMRSPELAKLSEDEVLPLVMADLRRLLGVRGEPVFKKMYTWKKSIPQYNVGYAQMLETMDQIEMDFPTVTLLGAYRGGVGVSSCIENAIARADKIVGE